MQRQWTIEARADFTDPDKNAVITKAIQEAAVHVYAQLALLSDGVQPEVAAFSEDFFAGHEQISLLEDSIGKAKGVDIGGDDDFGLTDELTKAAAELKSRK